MPTITVWLDDDYRVVPPEQATTSVVKEIDAAGELVSEKWIRLTRPGSPEADRLEIERGAADIAYGEAELDEYWPPGGGAGWLLVGAIVGFLVGIALGRRALASDDD